MLDFGNNFMHRTLGKMAGCETLQELAQFLLGLSTMFDGFRTRYQQVRTLLRSQEVAFNLVTAPSIGQFHSMLRFHDELKEAGCSPKSLVINRLRSSGARREDIPVILNAVKDELTQSELENLQVALTEEAILAKRDQEMVNALKLKLKALSVISLPELPLNPHDLGSLIELQKAFVENATSNS